MNRIVLIGNGFDLAHGLKTSYADFIDWYWEQWMNKVLFSMVPYINDGLCSVELNNDIHSFHSYFTYYVRSVNKSLKGYEFLQYLEREHGFTVNISPLLKNIMVIMLWLYLCNHRVLKFCVNDWSVVQLIRKR